MIIINNHFRKDATELVLIIALSLGNLFESSLRIDKKFLGGLGYVYVIELVRLGKNIPFSRTFAELLCLIYQMKVLARTFNLL